MMAGWANSGRAVERLAGLQQYDVMTPKLSGDDQLDGPIGVRHVWRKRHVGVKNRTLLSENRAIRVASCFGSGFEYNPPHFGLLECIPNIYMISHKSRSVKPRTEKKLEALLATMSSVRSLHTVS